MLIIIHHLVVDGVSWRILLEDFARVYRQIQNGQTVVLPEKTDSYQSWAIQLQQYAANGRFSGEIAYWRKLDKILISPLPRDYPATTNEVKQSDHLGFGLSVEDTEKLLTWANHTYQTQSGELLVAALGFALRQWTGLARFAVCLEGHGRENIIKGLNLTRTVGWFTSIYPLIMEPPDNGDMGAFIQIIKDTIRQIPVKGAGYGILKYLTPSNRLNESFPVLKPEICFNYLGRFDTEIENDLFSISPFSAGHLQSPEQERPFLLDIYGLISEKKLSFTVVYNREVHREETILRLIQYFKTNLRAVIENCLVGDQTGGSALSEHEMEGLTREDMEEISTLVSELDI